jgi:hypothetical protein
MLECIDNGFYSYPISHVIIPMIITRYYGNGFNSVLFGVFAAALWEMLEVITVSFFESYVLFGDSFGPIGGGTETLCNAMFLDVGNGILGALLAWVTTGGTLKKTINYWIQWVIFILVGLLYSYLSGFSWYCSWDPDCDGEMVDFPWGNIANLVVVVIWMYFCFADWYWLYFNVFVISIFGTIPIISSAVMVYVGTAICFVVQSHEIPLCILLLPLTPFIYLYNALLNKDTPFICSYKTAYRICLDILEKNSTDIGILASQNEYTDVWTRDAFFAIMGLKSKGLEWDAKTIETLTKFQREDGLIPLYVGRGDAFSKLICRTRPSGPLKAQYGDYKTGDIVTDSCFQFIIMAGPGPASERAWKFMQQYVKDGLIYEEGLGSWMDTVYHKGNVLYTNVLYYQAAKVLRKDYTSIRSEIYNKLWNGRYFDCSSTVKSFDQVGNALAIIYNMTEQKESIIRYRRDNFTLGLQNPPCMPKVTNIYLPCYMIGNQQYHNFGWSWVNLLFLSVMDSNDLDVFTKEIEKRGTIHEIYTDYGPVNQLFCRSQPEFSEAAGMYLLNVGSPEFVF